MSSHNARPRSTSTRRAKPVKAPRFGPEWYRKRRLATRRRVAAMSRRRRTWRRTGILGTWLLAGLAVVLIVAVIGFYSLSNVVTPDQIKTDQVATILYSDGSVMARIGAENRTDVKIGDVPEAVKWEVLAAEDRGYYSNPGISISGTLRAAWNDVTGGATQGGSGITQQYVKNAYLNSDQTLSRKLRELAIAVKLDRNYSKDQILEYYLNTIYFGRGAYGIQAASQAYFGVDVGKLDVAQGAVLAALIRSPGDYDPAVDPQAAKDRWTYVLDGMVTTGHLTSDQEHALTFPTVNPPSGTGLGATGPVGLIVNQVKNELAADGVDESTLNTRGLTISTTIDPKAQNDAQASINSTFSGLKAVQGPVKKALVAVQPGTGAVLAYWGGVNDSTDYLDYAGGTCQAPGSSFKPYTLAVGLTNTISGVTPAYSLNSVVDGSTPQTIDGTVIANDPSDRQYSSKSITVARAMQVSLNTVFDGMAYAVGPPKVAAVAHAAGIASTCGGSPTLVDLDAKGQSTGTTSFGIGIGDYPVHTIDQAVGFSTFVDGGTTHPAYFINKVTAADGSVLYQHKDAGTRAMDPRVANDVTVSLGPVASFSLDSLARSRASASKTGTVGIEACKDGKAPDDTTNAGGNCADVGQNSSAWTVGCTPAVCTAVWAGSGDSTTAIRNRSGGAEYGRDLPGRAWKSFLDTYLAGTPNQSLPTKAQITGGQNVRPTESPSAATPTPSISRSEASPSPSTSSATPTGPTPTPTPTPTPSTPAPSGTAPGQVPSVPGGGQLRSSRAPG